MIVVDENLVVLEREDVLELLERKLEKIDPTKEIHGVQICVETPFGEGMKVHNDIPSLNLILVNRRGS